VAVGEKDRLEAQVFGALGPVNCGFDVARRAMQAKIHGHRWTSSKNLLKSSQTYLKFWDKEKIGINNVSRKDAKNKKFEARNLS